MDRGEIERADPPLVAESAYPNNLAYTTPLFIQHTLLIGGRDDTVTSASGTFVKFGGHHFVVTCRHVLDAADHARHINLAIQAGRMIFNLSHQSPEGTMSSVYAPKAGLGGRDIDIAIAGIDHCWRHLVDSKGKKAIDLDHWVEPSWEDIEQAAASGWLNNYKEMTEENVSTKGVTAVLPMASGLSADHPQFTLFAEKAKNADIVLSGISGGVIFSAGYQPDLPLGIIFEGYPSEVQSVTGRADGYTGGGDVMIRGHVLSPRIFEEWLSNL